MQYVNRSGNAHGIDAAVVQLFLDNLIAGFWPSRSWRDPPPWPMGPSWRLKQKPKNRPDGRSGLLSLATSAFYGGSSVAQRGRSARRRASPWTGTPPSVTYPALRIPSQLRSTQPVLLS